LTASLSFSGLQARIHDPDRFLLSLLVEKERQVDLWPLIAFNYEIARTREVVTDTNIGLIRLQWWRDALEKIYAGEGVAPNEIVEGLAAIIKKNDLPMELFNALLYAREFDLEDVSPASLEGLIHYADFTHTPLVQLILKVLGETEDECRGSAISYALTGLMNGILFHARQRRCYLPTDLMQEEGIDLSVLYELKPHASLPGVVEQICNQAGIYLFTSNPKSKFLRGMDKLTSLYLKRMKACKYDPFEKDWIKPPAFKELRVALAAR
jgi:phytoene synthase